MLGGVRLVSPIFHKTHIVPGTFYKHTVPFFFFFLLLHIKFKIVFNSPLGDEELLPALHPLMFYSTLSQIQDVSTIRRQVNFLYIHSLFFFILHLHLCHVRLLRACWVTYSSSFPSTKITPPPERASGQTSDLHSQLWVFPPQTKDIVCVCIEAIGCDEMFNLVRLCAEQTRLAGAAPSEGHNDFTSETRETRSAMLPLWERHTHTHECSHIHIYALLCGYVLICVPM